MEKTLVMIKPDGVARSLVGRIISIFENTGLSIVAMRMITPTADMVLEHYPASEKWLTSVGEKTLESYANLGLDVSSELGTDDPKEIGNHIREWLVEYITSGRIVAMVLEGISAVANVRRICGTTLPNLADPGSIRGQFSLDSADAATRERRAVMNLVHASGTPDEALSEIKLWFPEFPV